MTVFNLGWGRDLIVSSLSCMSADHSMREFYLLLPLLARSGHLDFYEHEFAYFAHHDLYISYSELGVGFTSHTDCPRVRLFAEANQGRKIRLPVNREDLSDTAANHLSHCLDIISSQNHFILPLKNNRDFISRSLYPAVCPSPRRGWLSVKTSSGRQYFFY